MQKGPLGLVNNVMSILFGYLGELSGQIGLMKLEWEVSHWESISNARQNCAHQIESQGELIASLPHNLPIEIHLNFYYLQQTIKFGNLEFIFAIKGPK